MAEHSQSYLQKLKFDPTLTRSWIAKYLSNPRLLFLVLISVITLGIASYVSLPRRLNPEVEIPLVIVSTVLPGANPQDMESLVTEPLESAVRALDDVSTVTSTSQDNVSVIQIEFSSGVNTDDARTNVQSAVDQVELPEDAQAPTVQKIDFENQPVWTFALTGSDIGSLSRMAKIIKDDLEELPSIDNVQTGGLEEQEISVEISPSQISSYGVNTMQLGQIVRAALSSFPAGTVQTETSSFTVSIDPLITNIEDVRNLKLNLNGTVVPLSSVATITERAKPDALGTYFASHEQTATPTIVFNVFKTASTNIDTAVHDAETVVEEQVGPHGNSFAIKTITNTGELIDEQFTELLRDFALTIILVFIVLFIFLGARQAFVSFFAVPLTFFISFTVMRLSGISLNFLSMFSLLLSLGLLVDDTIVVISAMTSYWRTRKFTAIQTGLLVWRDFLVAILTTTLTTVWAFLPLLLASGIIGEFIKSIPIVVSSTLLASFFVAMFMTLPLMIVLLKPNVPRRVNILLKIIAALIPIAVFIAVAPKNIFLVFTILSFLVLVFIAFQTRKAITSRIKQSYTKLKGRNAFVRRAPYYADNGLIKFGVIGAWYRKILDRILSSRTNRRRAVIMVVIFSLFSYLLLPLGFVKNEFFPSSDSENLYVSLELPAGTNANVTEQEAQNLLNQLRTTQDVSYIIATVGQSFSSDRGGASGGNANTALLSFTLPKLDERNRTSIEVAEQLRTDFASYTKGTITVAEISGGPPAGADIQIKLFGENLAVLNANADKLIKYLEQQQGVTDVSKSIKEGTSKLAFKPDTDAMAQNNITQDSVGLLLRTFASGMTLETANLTGTDDEDIMLRLGSGQPAIEDLYRLSVPTMTGNIPLAQLGNFELRSNPTLITREDGERTISVTAGVGQGYTPAEVNQKLEEYANTGLELPEGYRWATGGVNEENQESVNSILIAMLLSFLLIIVTMVIQFSSFRRAIIVMLVIPLSISGVFIIFALSNTPLSFPALIGVLALFGIVVKNSILIVDKITANEKIGMTLKESVIDATESRLEPIALTSLAAIMGLIPITLSDPLWRGLGGAIIAGLTFSGAIMLIFIPVVYYIWFGGKDTEARVRRQTRARRQS